MAMTRNSFPSGYTEGIDLILGMEADAIQEEWKPLFEVKGTDKATWEMAVNYGLGNALEVGEGDDFTFDEGGEAGRLTARIIKVGLGFEVTEEAKEDNVYMDVGAEFAKDLVRSLKETKAIFAARIFNEAFSGTTGYDGKTLLATDHPLGRQGAGTFANKPTVAAQLAETALDDIRVMVRTCKTEEGRYANLKPQQLILHPALGSVASRLLMSSLRPGTNANDVNWIKEMGMFPKGVHELTHLSDTAAWFVKTDARNGLIHVNRRGVVTRHSIDENNGTMRTTASERYKFVFGNPRCMFGSTGA